MTVIHIFPKSCIDGDGDGGGDDDDDGGANADYVFV